MGFGPPVGFGGANSVDASRNAGLPHAGVPGHLQEAVDAVLDREPDHPAPVVEFSHVAPDERPFTLRSFLGPHRRALVGAGFLVVLEAVALQAGPLLTQIGIDRVVVPGDRGVLVAVAIAYLVSIVLHGFA